MIESPGTPGGCWAHFSSVLVPGYRTLGVGQSVTVEYEVGEQDGFQFRAVEVWPEGQEPFRDDVDTSGSDAFRSSLTLTFDDPDTPPREIE